MQLIKNNEEISLIEIFYENKIDRMSQEGFNGTEKYIKLEKGPNKIMTIFDKKSDPMVTFRFGDSGTTLISNNLKKIRGEVLEFLCSKGINPNMNTKEIYEEIVVFPPQKGFSIGDQVYNIHMGGKHAIFINGAEKMKELFGELEKKEDFVSAQTGATSFLAKNKNTLKLPNTSGII